MDIFKGMFKLKKKKEIFGHEKRQETMFPLLQYKNILLKKEKVMKNQYIYTDFLVKKYNNYILQLIKLDNNIKEDKIRYELNNNYILDNKSKNNLIVRNKNKKIMKFFNKSFYEEDSRNKIFQYEKNNMFKEHIYLLRTRKISNKLTKPHYFFTSKYNEKAMVSQIKHWISSTYSFKKDEKSGQNYLDLYTSKLIKLFFTVKYIKRKKTWNIKLIEGFKIIPNISVIKDINTIIKYTSNRTSSSLKTLISFPPVILTFKWVIKQIKLSDNLSKIIDLRKNEIFSGYYPKKKDYLRKLTRIIIGKPFFKHTSNNIIIDLFVFNNKTHKIKMLKNIITRRSLYKYMYSMYVDNSAKIKETISKPRFFFINLIEPKIYNYYYWVIKWYEELIIRSKNSSFRKIYLLILQLNFIPKNKYQTITNKFSNLQTIFHEKALEYLNIRLKNFLNYYKFTYLNKTEKFLMYLNNKNRSRNLPSSKINLNTNKFNDYNIKLFIKDYHNKEIKRNNLNQYYKIIINNKLYNIDYYNIKKDLIDLNKDKSFNKKVFKNAKEKKSKYFLYKKYLLDLEKKSNTPFDLNTLTMWSRKGLGRKTVNEIIKEKIFRHDKYSYGEFKRRNLYEKGKKVSPKVWKKKLMSFFLFSKKQKRDTSPNKIFLNKYKRKNNISNDKDNVNYEYNSLNEKRRIDSNNYIKKENKNSVILFNKDDKKENEIRKLIKDKKIEFKELKEPIIIKEEYIHEIDYSNYNNENLLNKLFNKFSKYKNYKINDNEEGKRLIVKLENSSINYKRIKNLLNVTKNVNYNFISYFQEDKKSFIHKQKFNKLRNNFVGIGLFTKHFNRKLLWDNSSYSLMNVFFKSSNIEKSKELYKQKFGTNYVNYGIKKLINYGDVWYLLYYLNFIKKEFHKVKRDVLEIKNLNGVYIDYNKKTDSYNNDYSDINLPYKNNRVDLTEIKFWRSYYSNKRENYINNKLGFIEKLFKPYYRYMIPMLIVKSYYYFISYLGYKNSIFNLNKYLIKNRNDITGNNNFIFNFVIVKTLLDLLHYNYRSLIRVKHKYYYLNKLRLYGIKFNRLNYNSWTNSIKYFRSLRKTPRKFWIRYHKVASYYYARINENADLDTKRKILLPFVLYFEDILFSIYGKWAIIRLWPVRKYFLSSYILANRILLLMLWRGKHQKYKYDFQKITAKLIYAFRALQIKKAHDFYYTHTSRWSNYLINKINNTQDVFYNSLNYSNLEFYISKIGKNDILSTYPLLKNNFSNYLPIINCKYTNIFNNYLDEIKRKKSKHKILKDIKNYELSRLEYSYYLLKPLKNYLISLIRYLYISGIKFLMSGRTGIKRNNLRSIRKTKFYGNLIGPRYISDKLLKSKTVYIPHLRGYIKSNIDYTKAISKSKNGSISLKIWMSSLISSDIHELLLHILRIKDLYFQVINRYYIVDSNLFSLNNYYSFSSVKNNIMDLKIKDKKWRRKK